MGCKIAPATYYEHRSRMPSRQEMRDAELKPHIAAAHAAHYGVFGARKIWLTLNRERPAGAAPIARLACLPRRLVYTAFHPLSCCALVERRTSSGPTPATTSKKVGRRENLVA